MTNSEWSETLSQRPTVHTQSRNFAGNLYIQEECLGDL